MNSEKPAVIPAPVWWRDDVLDDMCRFGPTRGSPYEVGRHLAVLLLLLGGRRIHDLTLLHTTDGDLIYNERQAIFQPRFGSKTDGKYIQSKMGFRRHQDWALSVSHVLTHYLRITSAWRQQHTALFLRVRGNHEPASPGIIRGWVRKQQEKSGVRAAPGSCRAAANTASFLEGCRIDDVLKNGNWCCRGTFLKYYFRPAEQW